MKKVTENYAGRDNLAAMRAAPRYNKALLGLVMANACGSRILDFGAGDGLFAEMVAEQWEKPVCVEPDPDLAGVLRQQGFDTHFSIDTVEGLFDHVYTINVLEHIGDDERVLRDIAAKTARNGRLVIFVPAWPLLYGSMDRRVGHVRRYRKEDLLRKLERAGWAVDYARYFDSLGFLGALAYRFLGPSDGDLSSRSLAFYDRWVFPASRFIDHLVPWAVGKNLIVEARRVD